MSTPILTEPVHDPMAWAGADFAGDDDLVYRLTPATVAGLEEILVRVRDLPRDDIGREHVGHPDVDGPAREVYEELIRGRGLVVVRGFPVAEHTIDENERIFWIWLSHFGELLSNNSFGHRMVRVQQEVLARRRAAGAGHEVGGRARDAQRLRRPVLPALGPAGRAGRREPVLERARRARHDPRHPSRHPADPLPRLPAPPPQRAARPPARRHALRRPDLRQRRRPHLASTSPTAASCPRCTRSAASSPPRRTKRSRSSGGCSCSNRWSCACSRATRRWPTTTRCATRAPTSSTATTPTQRRLRPAGVERGARRGPPPPARPRVLPHGERGRPPRLRPRSRAGGSRSRSTTTATSTKTSPNLFKATQAKPKLD